MIDIETLKEYIKVLEDCSLAEIEISDEEDSIRLAKPSADSPVAVLSAQGSAPQTQFSAPAAPTASAASGNAIKSPMVGVFYSAPAPDRPPFVNVGDTVNKGDVVCIIEAMKIMNEITADKSGTITEVLVENGDIVEYDQPLFNIG